MTSDRRGFDPERDPAEQIHDLAPHSTPWRRRASIVEGTPGGISRPGGMTGCSDCEKTGTDEPTGKRSGFFPYLRGNRSLSILLIDTIIVVALFFIVLFVMVPSMGRVRIDDMRVETTVETSAAMVTVRAEFYQRMRQDAAGLETRIVAIAAAGEVLRDLAPSPGQRRVLEISFPRSRVAGDELVLDILVGEERRTLTRPIVD